MKRELEGKDLTTGTECLRLLRPEGLEQKAWRVELGSWLPLGFAAKP